MFVSTLNHISVAKSTLHLRTDRGLTMVTGFRISIFSGPPV